MRFYLMSVIIELEVILIKFIGVKNTCFMRNLLKRILKIIRSAKRGYNNFLGTIHYYSGKGRVGK